MGKTILAIGGHIGDMELTAGGLMATNYLDGGKNITLALTAGERGNPPHLTQKEYRVQKIAEAKAFMDMMNGEALVLKYADGIVKCFCNAITIVLISIISWIIEDSTPTAQFFLGALIVISAVNIYTLDCFIPSSIGVYVKQKLNYKSLSVWNKRQCI